MSKFEIDVELLSKKNALDNDFRASIMETLFKEFNIKFEKFYALRDSRHIRKKERVYIEEEDTTIIYTFQCIDAYYDFLVFLFKKRASNLEKVLKSYEC